jgi:hypothetical protein
MYNFHVSPPKQEMVGSNGYVVRKTRVGECNKTERQGTKWVTLNCDDFLLSVFFGITPYFYLRCDFSYRVFLQNLSLNSCFTCDSDVKKIIVNCQAPEKA